MGANCNSSIQSNLPFFDEIAPPPFYNVAVGVFVSVTLDFVLKGYTFEVSPMTMQHHDHHVYHRHHHHIMIQRIIKYGTSDNNLQELSPSDSLR
ncbi:hypothetical protein Ahy_A04g020347 isoform C [Arachis hypogaea]|uniref:Uncharacterized protein n=1 Tax=Arachis hypogaea TaxID=3818 RepID=A0A445DHJ2_ARAHY|nr:hypothetical protein Ahy_A04g020347 isoform C [Arachis hypogaea]